MWLVSVGVGAFGVPVRGRMFDRVPKGRSDEREPSVWLNNHMDGAECITKSSMPSGRLNEGFSWWIVTDAVDTSYSGFEAIFTACLTRRGDARFHPENNRLGISGTLQGGNQLQFNLLQGFELVHRPG